ncbi:LacI family DNA-binding transcriptional regulator [Marinitenerispora sediminis]|uniref:LacI family transcriptional regulator n=1 Tax=Marinitenerispora sediminis TaxID=1931232 RepID=A0A368T212_9ACTN|nr:LacI family DNA-binding transcriptional regulator [Marinitenerispora sediminis]RCV51560.1 LacI family transcriptional regulator [Marinitenerispora sediminis]RCV54452.1 LacI family transcriptional regulator [Marinitenerispora sediminis]RCV55633.1 LacI family transcriptional regulator [Marinitenerispora sediminis]
MAARGSPTITTIAEAAGVSIASVSRVLNGLPVRAETERRVLDAAGRLGYVPNSVARSLRSARTHQIAFAVEDIGNPVYLAMLREIQPLLKAAGYRLVLHSTGADTAEEVEVLRGLGQRYADGLIIVPIRVTDEHVAELRAVEAPVVVIGSLPGDGLADNVRTDSRRGVDMALRHLAELGRRRIGFINGPADTVPGGARSEAFRAGTARAGLTVEDGALHEGRFDRETGAEGVRRMAEGPAPMPDALLCANDLIALGALDALRARGLDVPGDVAVVGMDDTDLAAVSWPPLTSVSLGSAERGRHAARLLLDRLDSGAAPSAPRVVTVEPRLVVRASTGGARVVDNGSAAG